MLKKIVWIRTVWQNWIAWNRNIFDIWIVQLHLNCVLMLNPIVGNGAVIEIETVLNAKLICLILNSFEIQLCVNTIYTYTKMNWLN